MRGDSTAREDAEYAAHAGKSYASKAIASLVLYFVGLYFVGLVANVMFLREAEETRAVTGYDPHGVGCLRAMLFVQALSVALVVAACILFLGGSKAPRPENRPPMASPVTPRLIETPSRSFIAAERDSDRRYKAAKARVHEEEIVWTMGNYGVSRERAERLIRDGFAPTVEQLREARRGTGD